MRRTIFYRGNSNRKTPKIRDFVVQGCKLGHVRSEQSVIANKNATPIPRPLGSRRTGVQALTRWTSPAALQRDIDQYFESCISREVKIMTDIYGVEAEVEVVIQKRAFTMTGLAFYLDVTRATLSNYKNEDGEYYDVVTRAQARVEAYAEEMLFTGKATQGVMFSLKNSFRKDWMDTTHTELSGGLNSNVSVSVNDDRAKAARAILIQQVQVEGEIVSD